MSLTLGGSRAEEETTATATASVPPYTSSYNVSSTPRNTSWITERNATHPPNTTTDAWGGDRSKSPEPDYTYTTSSSSREWSTAHPAASMGENNESSTHFPGYINIQNISLDSPMPWEPWISNDTGPGSDCLWSNDTLCFNPNNTNASLTTGTSPTDVDTRYWTLLLLIFPFFTAFGNILVCLSVYKEKSLQSVTNYFIVSLAVADIMVALLVMPLAVYVEFQNGVWQLGNGLCDTWVAMDVMCCTASILNLTAISVDRFIAVTQPIKYAKHKNSNRVYVMVALVWLVSLAISSPIALGMNYTERRAETPEMCIFYNSDFIIYSSMGSFYIPCVVMVLLYWRIFKVIRDRARKTRKKAKPMPRTEQKKALSANVIENKAHCKPLLAGGSGGNGAVGNCRQTTSDASATEDNSQRELLPSKAMKPLADKAIIEETSFTKYNAGAAFTTDTEDNQQVGGKQHKQQQKQQQKQQKQQQKQEQRKREEEDEDEEDEEEDTDHVIRNDKTLAMTTSDEGMGGGAAGDHVTKGGQQNSGGSSSKTGSGYSAPSCVEVAPIGTEKAGAKSKVLLSPPPPRRNMRLGLISVFSPSKHLSINSHMSDNGDNGGSSPNKKSVTKFNFHLRHSKKKKEKLSNRRERKATKTLAIVLGVFLLCWVPFFTINIMNAICIRYDLFTHRPECTMDSMLFSFFVWLGYINSFLNPVIYTIFNLDFRRAFKKLLQEPCK